MITTIDPRIRARRAAVRRQEGRKRLRRLVWMGAVAAVVLAVLAATQSPLLDVDHVRVAGNERTAEAELVEASGLTIGEAMTGVDLGGAEDAIAALPWVDEVSVRRSWPGSIEIEITERQPVAAFGPGGSDWTVVDREGRVLAVHAAIPVDLPRIAHTQPGVEPGVVLAELASVVAFADALSPDLAAWVERLVAVDGAAVDLELVGGAVARAAGFDIDAELTALATVLTRIDLQCVDRIDLGVARAPALHRDRACEAAAVAEQNP